MDRDKIKKSKKRKIGASGPAKSSLRTAHLMSKERLIDALARLSVKKTGVKKAARGQPWKAQKVVRQIKVLPQVTGLRKGRLSGGRYFRIPPAILPGKAGSKVV